ncbi:hypothetical protein KBB49_01740 [Candidatus Saccharibacteria bacterium]|nr:hypothetical protein [Candidatus Saccharibacteria bacterium]
MMPKPIILIAGALVVTGAVVGVLLTSNKDDEPAKSNQPASSNETVVKNNGTTLDDPEGVYDLFSDPSVTEYPEKGALFGNGQTLTFEYDGSKSANDEYATLSYQLYYIQEDGKVQPMGGGNMDGEGGKGTFTVSNSVFNSSAKDRSGFLELQVTYSTSLEENNDIAGKTETLGMYSVKFDVAE